MTECKKLERERLIELFCNCCLGEDEELFFTSEESAMLADYLLKNGVIVPPCKVGDTVYLIPTYGGRPYCGVREDKVQMIGVTSRGIHIKAKEHHDHNKTYMLGKTAFLTPEEAKKAEATLSEVK